MKDRTNRIEHREVNTLEAKVCSRNAKEPEPAHLVVEMTASSQSRCHVKGQPGRISVSQVGMAHGMSRSVKKALRLLSARSIQCLFWG